MKKPITVVLLFSLFSSQGQERKSVFENNFAINYKLKSWRLNSSIASRTLWVEENETTRSQAGFLEINQFGTRSLSPKISFSLGYKLRSVHPVSRLSSNEHRITAQVAWRHLERRARLVSRLRLEQRFRNQFAHRYRYRLSFDLPLSGLKLDAREFYFIFANEVLLQLSPGETNDWQNRVTAGVGYLLSRSIKFQVDLTSRFENIQEEVTMVPFIHTNLIFTLSR